MGRIPVFVTIGIALLIQWGCARDGKIHEFQDEDFYMVLVVDPEADCVSCVQKGIQVLQDCMLEDGEKIHILVLNPAISGPFRRFSEDLAKGNNLCFHLIPDAQLPHPALMMFRGNRPLWYLYLSSDVIELAEVVRRTDCISKQLHIF